MTITEARFKISMHAGRTENFFYGYRYALKYGFRNLECIQHQFDEIFICLKILRQADSFLFLDKELLADLSEILWGSILYINRQETNYHIIGVFAEVLSETLLYLLENTEEPFIAFDYYKENYDDILCKAVET